MTNEILSRRRLVRTSVAASVAALAGCFDAGYRGGGSDPQDDDEGTPESDDDETEGTDQELPTDPDEDDFVDMTGEDVVEIETREGANGKPEFVFDPPFVRVDQGTTIRWVNADGVFHTVTSTTSLEDRTGGGDVFDAEIRDEGDTFEWTAETAGRQDYYCLPHTGFMWGSIEVVGEDGVPEDEDDGDESEEIDQELPTDPDEDDFVDMTGEDVVEIETRQGDDGEPAFVFDPPFVRVDQGTTIRWVNTDGVFHTVTSTTSLDRRSGGGDTFDAQISAVGDSFEWTAETAGRQDYYCSPHAGFMFGSIDVV